MPETLLITAAAGFEAACRVDALPEGHRARRLHGHGYVARLRAALPAGWAAFPGGEVDELERRLRACVAPLDYGFLNDTVPDPTDENLARWVRARLGANGEVPGIDAVGVQSTRDCGADLDGADVAHVWRRHAFQSAHRLPNVPAGHKCGRMHGHGFEVILHARVAAAGRALGVDYDAIDAAWALIARELDHACLNDLPGLGNPTSELIASWIWGRLKPALPSLAWVTVYETASCGAHYDGARWRIWKEFSLDSAVRLARAPEGDPRRRIHGHTFTLRLHLSAPLDAVLGWTQDFGDVKELFSPVFARIDHQPLHELPGLVDGDAVSLARWIQAECAPMLPALDRIDLEQVRGCGAILAWGDEAPALPV